MHDLYEMERPPYRRPIPIVRPSDRIGLPYIQVDPSKIAGVVETNMPDEARGFHESDPVTDKIGQNVLSSWLRTCAGELFLLPSFPCSRE